MRVEDKNMPKKQLVKISAIVGGIGLLILLFGGEYRAIGSLMIFTAIMLWVYRMVLRKMANRFQKKTLVRLENWYEKRLVGSLKSKRPYWIIGGTFTVLLAAFVAFGASVASQRTKIEFFPDNKPNQIIVYIEYPQGTDIEKTNAITKEIEKANGSHGTDDISLKSLLRLIDKIWHVLEQTNNLS